MAVLNSSKTNGTGRRDITGMVRNKDAAIRSIGAFALYLIKRFYLNGALLPDLSDRENWNQVLAFVDGASGPSSIRFSVIT